MAERYLFSIVVDDAGAFASSKNECEVNLMVTTEERPRYVFKIRDADVNTFEEATTFPFSDKLIDLMLLRSYFIVRVLRSKNGRVEVIRLYSRNDVIETELNNTHFSNRLALENEQALLDLIQDALGKIIIEPNYSTPIRLKRKWGDMKFKVPSKRSLAPEQRLDAQSLTDAVHSSRRVMTANVNIDISDSLVIDPLAWSFGRKNSDKPDLTFSWSPVGGFLNYTRGCGRKRTLAAMLDAISSGGIDEGSISENRKGFNLNKYFAKRLSLIVCEADRVEKWKESLGENSIVIKTRNDLDNVTYNLISNGITIIVSIDAVVFFREDGIDTIEQVRKMTFLADSRSRELDDIYYQRLHVSSIAERLPQARAPLSFVTARCLIVDIKNKEQCIKESYLISKVLEADWTWMCLGFEGPPPSHLSFRYLQWAQPILFPGAEKQIIANTFAGDLGPSQSLPDFWRILNDPTSGIVQNLTMPKSILRRVTLILDKSTASERERAFLQTVTKIRQSMTAVPVPPMSTSSSAVLLGTAYDNIAGCQVHIALPRTLPLSQANAERNVDSHFADDLRGTLAQRVGAGNSANVDATLIPMGTLSEASFVKRAVREKGDGICQVCYSDPVSVVTLCGHCFCGSCVSMLRVKEARGGGVTTCPVCRAALSSYDWITIGDQSSEVLTIPSKIQGLLNAISSVFSKRRHKKRSPMCAWVIVPESAHKVVSTQLLDAANGGFEIADMSQSEASFRQQIPKIRLMTFDEVSKETEIGDNVDALFMTCPAQSSMIYYDLIRSCETRSTPLQLFLLVSQGVENPSDAVNIYI
jgi:hypothetical protein